MALRDAKGTIVVAFFYKIELQFPISFSPLSGYVLLPYQTLRILMNSKNAFREMARDATFSAVLTKDTAQGWKY